MIVRVGEGEGDGDGEGEGEVEVDTDFGRSRTKVYFYLAGVAASKPTRDWSMRLDGREALFWLHVYDFALH